MIRPVYSDGGRVFIIDQTLLPGRLEPIEINTVEEMREAMCNMRVRGAPALGLAGAFGVYLGVRNAAISDTAAFHLAVNAAAERLCGARPTAGNIFWAVGRMKEFASKYYFTNIKSAADALLNEAETLAQSESQASRSIGLYGADLLEFCRGILTHCNAGALAAPEYGTATAPLYVLRERGYRFDVYVDETRPLLQGARLTAWELAESGINVTLIADSMAGAVLRDGLVDAVIVGADRIVRNGDAANKVGTYALSVLAAAHKIPFYVAAPFSTVDFDMADGTMIPIEQRQPEELSVFAGVQTTHPNARIFNPAFDVTPAKNITAYITEYGVARSAEELKSLKDYGRLRG
ncbi:MAG: S-methyl-5-thioribose-1-phosphate isomerase [Oscillospiraceae bacterium]|nr:S-methyl-5-thioribose-1-phosphate isomerase [Oscillospiraceae bacterium]